MNKKHKEFTAQEISQLGSAWYRSKQWQHKRREILKRDHFECQRCRAVHHRYRKADTVHHIKHLDMFPELALNDDNLVSLCYDCHNEVHPEKVERFERNAEKKWKDERW